MKIELRKIESVKPYENNPRQNEQAVEAVAISITEFGFRQPIVVDESDVIIVGHTRFKAALKLGMKQVPVHVARGLTPEQAKAYRIADNQTASLSTWDTEKLPLELSELQRLDVDLSLTGFSSDELVQLMDDPVTEGKTDPDAVPEPPDEPITRIGDLWLLGEHRLLCGDTASSTDMDHLLEGEKVQLVHSDPPYGVNLQSRSQNALTASLSGAQRAKQNQPKLRAKDRPLANDEASETDYAKLLNGWFTNIARVLEPGRGFYLWGGYVNLTAFPIALREAGLYFSQGIVWVKEHPVLSRKDFMSDFEFGFYGWKEGRAHQYFGPNNATDVWQVKKVRPQKMVHPTEKPVGLAARAIQYSSKSGEVVLDPFGGSGSTLIAAEQASRRAHLMEIDPLYCDVIVRRFEEFTGSKAQRIQVD